MDNQFDNALNYHADGRPGKIEVVPTKPTQTKREEEKFIQSIAD